VQIENHHGPGVEYGVNWDLVVSRHAYIMDGM